MRELLLTCLLLTAVLFGGTSLQITKGPSVEFSGDQSAIITWATNTNGKSIVHYGLNAKDLTDTAESPNRWNPNLPYMVHRVLMLNLKPSTTYYYTVESAGVKSAVCRFTTRTSQRP
jgi:phosphodiesterase/alkaline phosphatase D-like protein